MFICTSDSVKGTVTPWGAEVVRRLKQRGMKQTEFVEWLRVSGVPKADKSVFSQWLRGTAVKGKLKEISIINSLLEIPQASDFSC